MITVRLAVKPYLAAYMYALYERSTEPLTQAIRLNPQEILYSVVQQLTVRRPANAPRETGNLCLALPAPRYGKDPQVYNYIGHDNARLLEEKIEWQMKMELFEWMQAAKFRQGKTYHLAILEFMEKYGLEELLQEETMMRWYQRWRAKRTKA